MNITRRITERIPLRSSPFHATWLSDWQRVDENGVLADISTGGFSGCIAQAPAKGHLLHARLTLRMGSGRGTPLPIELDARICGRTPGGSEDSWIIHCAIETIHPVDEKLMIETIKSLGQGCS
jgi:hypothetical protein